MKWWLLIPVVLLVLLQTTVTGFNWLLVLLLALVLSGQEKEALVFAFLGGVLLDLSGGTTLGLSSLGYLISLALILAYSRKFQLKNGLFWLVIFLAGSFLFKAVRSEIWHWQEGLLTGGLGLFIFFLLERLGVLGEEEGIKLKI